MTIAEKRRFLYQYVNCKGQIEALLEDRAFWESVGTSMTGGNGTGSGRSSGSKVETSYVNIDQIKDDIDNEIKSCVEKRRAVVNAIEQVRTGKYKTVLYMVFIAGNSIEDVAANRCCEERKISGMIRRGIEQIDWPETEKQNEKCLSRSEKL